MPLQPVANKRLYLQVAEQIAQAIHSGEYPVGSVLPPERALKQHLEVSRASIREALVALQLMELVDVRPGEGAVVKGRIPKGVSPDELRNEVSAFELLQARKIVESGIAQLAAESATDEDLNSLRNALALMQREVDVDAAEEEGDRRFHLCLAAATKNTALDMIAQSLWGLRRQHLWQALDERAFTHQHRQTYVEDHQRVLACIAQKDGPGARLAMDRHLERVERHFLEANP